MSRQIQTKFMTNEYERTALNRLIKLHQVSMGELLRRLVKEEAERLNVWPEVKKPDRVTP